MLLSIELLLFYAISDKLFWQMLVFCKINPVKCLYLKISLTLSFLLIFQITKHSGSKRFGKIAHRLTNYLTLAFNLDASSNRSQNTHTYLQEYLNSREQRWHQFCKYFGHL